MIKNILLITAFLTASFTYSQKQWTLKEAVNQALEKNITIRQNRLSVELSKKDVDLAKGNFLPNLNASSSGSFSFGSFIDRVSNTRISSDNFNSSFDLNSNITIFNGFRNLNSYKQAKLGVEASKYNLQVIENDISLFVVDGYLNILFAKENLEVAKVQYEISKKQVDAADARFNAGAVAKNDLLNAKSTVANDLQNVITQENALNIALLNLAQAIQVPVDNFDVAPIQIDEPSSELLFNNADLVYNKSLINRPEIERAKLNIESSQLDIEIAKGAYLPTLTAFAGAGSGYSHRFAFRNNDFFTQISDNLGYNLGASLNIPIFNRFQTKNNIAIAKINKQVSEIALEDEKIQLKQTIEQAFLDAKAALNSYEAAKISLEAQQEAFKNAEESFNFGAMTLFDFDLIRNRLVNAESTLIRAKYDYVFKTKVLEFYAGGLILE